MDGWTYECWSAKSTALRDVNKDQNIEEFSRVGLDLPFYHSQVIWYFLLLAKSECSLLSRIKIRMNIAKQASGGALVQYSIARRAVSATIQWSYDYIKADVYDKMLKVHMMQIYLLCRHMFTTQSSLKSWCKYLWLIIVQLQHCAVEWPKYYLYLWRNI